MNKKIAKIVFCLLICFLLLMGCESSPYSSDIKQPANELTSNEEQNAIDFATKIVKSRTYHNCTIEKTEYNTENKIYTVYFMLDNGQYKKVEVDTTSKNYLGNYNKAELKDWNKGKDTE